MFYEPGKDDHGLRGDPVKAIVTPRPVGWISSLDAEGRANLAPYSYFNLFSESPHVLFFSSHGRKHSLSNVEATGEFVCNLAVEAHYLAMHQTGAAVDEDEFAYAGLTPVPSRLVKPPRVAESPAALECRYLWTKEIFDMNGETTEFFVVAGQVVGVHLDERFVKDGQVDTVAMRPVGRLGYGDYAPAETRLLGPRLKGARV